MKRSLIPRLRSVPYRQPFVLAVCLSAIHYLGILAAATTLVAFVISPSHLATRVFMACIGFCAVTWLLAYFKRRATHCPLCKGTPLLDTGSMPHKNARRVFPFNHGVTAILSIIATHKFRCMHCGTGYDILKPPSHLHGGKKRAGAEEYTAYTPEDKP